MGARGEGGEGPDGVMLRNRIQRLSKTLDADQVRHVEPPAGGVSR
jgi:hypothetical protein